MTGRSNYDRGKPHRGGGVEQSGRGAEQREGLTRVPGLPSNGAAAARSFDAYRRHIPPIHQRMDQGNPPQDYVSFSHPQMRDQYSPLGSAEIPGAPVPYHRDFSEFNSSATFDGRPDLSVSDAGNIAGTHPLFGVAQAPSSDGASTSGIGSPFSDQRMDQGSPHQDYASFSPVRFSSHPQMVDQYSPPVPAETSYVPVLYHNDFSALNSSATFDWASDLSMTGSSDIDSSSREAANASSVWPAFSPEAYPSIVNQRFMNQPVFPYHAPVAPYSDGSPGPGGTSFYLENPSNSLAHYDPSGFFSDRSQGAPSGYPGNMELDEPPSQASAASDHQDAPRPSSKKRPVENPAPYESIQLKRFRESAPLYALQHERIVYLTDDRKKFVEDWQNEHGEKLDPSSLGRVWHYGLPYKKVWRRPDLNSLTLPEGCELGIPNDAIPPRQFTSSNGVHYTLFNKQRQFMNKDRFVCATTDRSRLKAISLPGVEWTELKGNERVPDDQVQFNDRGPLYALQHNETVHLTDNMTAFAYKEGGGIDDSTLMHVWNYAVGASGPEWSRPDLQSGPEWSRPDLQSVALMEKV